MRFLRPLWTAAAVALVCGPGPLGAQTEAPRVDRLSFDVLFGDNPGGRVPEDLAWAPDGRTLTYVWDDGEGKALWALDVAGRTRTRLLAEGGDDGIELDGYHWSPAGDHLLVESAGDLWLLTPGTGDLRRLTATAAEESDPRFAPDGGSLAFIREYDLWVMELPDGEPRALTTDGERNSILNGVPDWVYWEEIWGRSSKGYWWSPRGDKIAYHRFDEAPVGTYPLVDFTTVPYPTVEEQKYPKAGTANPRVRVGVLAAAGGDTVWLATGEDADAYLGRVDWLPSGDRVAVQRLNRDQNRLDLLSCSATTGACQLLLTETAETWVNLHDDLRFLADGRFLWSTERGGWSQLWLHAASGAALAPLTPEEWSLSSLDQVDETNGWFVYTAYSSARLGARGRQVLRGSLVGDLPARLSPATGWNAATVAPSGLWVLAHSTADSPERLSVHDADGKLLLELPAEPPPYDPAGLSAWEFFTLPGPEGVELPAALLRPAGFDPARRYPAIMYHYGGPASQVVADRWGSRGRGPWHKMMAQRGYAVLAVDNQGSNYFGKRGADRLHRRFGEINLAAQLAGVRYLEGLGWVDPGRIGLWGWSGGGSNTLYAILNRPGTWKAAVAGAPVTDWRLYDTIWTERYLDHPESNPEGYRLSSAVSHAANLADALLIVHGTADDNVHPQNTFAFVDALVAAQRPHELAIYPRQKHGVRGPASRHFYERMTEFFDRHLGPR